MFSDKRKINKCLLRLKHGEKCFDEFVKCSVGYIGYVVYNRLSNKSFFGDAVNETYRNIARYIANFDDDGNGTGWVSKIAENEAYKINKRECTDDVPLDDSICDIGTTDRTDSMLEVLDLYRAIDRLDDIGKKVIEYIFFEDKKYKEIAVELGLSIGDVCYRKKVALKQLLKMLSE